MWSTGLCFPGAVTLALEKVNGCQAATARGPCCSRVPFSAALAQVSKENSSVSHTRISRAHPSPAHPIPSAWWVQLATALKRVRAVARTGLAGTACDAAHSSDWTENCSSKFSGRFLPLFPLNSLPFLH